MRRSAKPDSLDCWRRNVVPTSVIRVLPTQARICADRSDAFLARIGDYDSVFQIYHALRVDFDIVVRRRMVDMRPVNPGWTVSIRSRRSGLSCPFDNPRLQSAF